jgi:hypothetical protein
MADFDLSEVAESSPPYSRQSSDRLVVEQPDLYDVLSGPFIAAGERTILIVWSSSWREPTNEPTTGNSGPDIWAAVARKELGYCIDEECLRSSAFPVEPWRYESSEPAAVWADDAYVVTWQDYRDGNYEIYVARVEERGEVEPHSLTNVSGSAGESQLPAIAAFGNELFLTWQEGAPPWEQGRNSDVLLSRSSDGGLTWESPLVVAAAVSEWPTPKVTTVGDTVGVAWVQDVPPEDDDELLRFEIRFTTLHCD